MRKGALLLLLLIAFSGFCFLEGRQTSSQEAPTVYTIYLPLVVAPPPPALRGVAFTGGPATLATVKWFYTWSWQCYADERFVPMIRGRPEMAHLSEAIECAKSHDGWLMGFNEPDMPEPYGNKIPPAEAAEMLHQMEEMAAGVKLVSPAPSQEDLDWLWRTVEAYEGKYGRKPRFNAIAVHWYNWRNPEAVQPAKDYLLRVRNEALAHGYDVPIWLTEFAAQCDVPDPEGGHQRLMRELIPWMRQQPWVARFAWFASRIRPVEPWCTGCHHCSLLDYRTGEPTTLGKLYGGY